MITYQPSQTPASRLAHSPEYRYSVVSWIQSLFGFLKDPVTILEVKTVLHISSKVLLALQVIRELLCTLRLEGLNELMH